MPLDYQVTVLCTDEHGRLYWRSKLSINDALLALLRFARKNPGSQCTIELRDRAPELHTVSIVLNRDAVKSADELPQSHLQGSPPDPI